MFALLLSVALAAPAAAHHVSGYVYCDADGSQTVTPADIPLNGMTIKAFGLGPNAVGTEYSTMTPYNMMNGRYFLDLFMGTNDYSLQLYGGIPENATFVSPPNGITPLHVESGNPDSEAQVVNFLLGNCGPRNLCKDGCDDQNPCTDDVCDAKTGCTHTPNTKTCDDHDACTSGDVCAKGVCVGGTPARCDDGNACTADTCKIDKGCLHTPTPESCDDHDPCTDDTCGVDGCVHTPNTGNKCSDGTVCTENDVCAQGVCTGTPLGCDDQNVCTDDSCKANVGCTHALNSAPCSDGNACTKNDQCTNGQCAGVPTTESCDDQNPCTDDTCGANGCEHTPNRAPCNDGNACTTNDLCADGVCNGKAVLCNDENPCTDDRCDAKKGCEHAFNSAPCSDGNACTTKDQCVNGKCSGLPNDKNCDDGNPCTDDFCDANGGCSHRPNTNECSDGNLCTVRDTCSGGVCKGAPKTCDDANLCNGHEVCNPDSGACEPVPGPPPFLACTEARFNNDATITGDLGVNSPTGLARLSRNSFMPDGTTITAHTVELAAGASVCGVKADSVSAVDAQIRCGTGEPSLPIVTPCCAIPAATCGNQAIAVGTDQNGVGNNGQALAPGAYGALTLAKGAVLKLLPGTFTFCSVDVSINAHLVMMGATTIHDTGNFRAADGSYVGPDSGQPIPTINVAGLDFRIGEKGTVRALVAAPNAEGRFGRSALLEGTLCIDVIGTDKNATLSCQPQTTRPSKAGKARKRHRRIKAAAN